MSPDHCHGHDVFLQAAIPLMNPIVAFSLAGKKKAKRSECECFSASPTRLTLHLATSSYDNIKFICVSMDAGGRILGRIAAQTHDKRPEYC